MHMRHSGDLYLSPDTCSSSSFLCLNKFRYSRFRNGSLPVRAACSESATLPWALVKQFSGCALAWWSIWSLRNGAPSLGRVPIALCHACCCFCLMIPATLPSTIFPVIVSLTGNRSAPTGICPSFLPSALCLNLDAMPASASAPSLALTASGNHSPHSLLIVSIFRFHFILYTSSAAAFASFLSQ